jgi:soluble lytic murein transglycosylase
MHRTLTCIKHPLAVALLAFAGTLCAAAPSRPLQDADILIAREASQLTNTRLLGELRLRFQGHLLESYPSYWYLNGSLPRADPAEVQAFLARYADSPLSEWLRRDWLKALGRAQAWDLFRAEFPKYSGDDPEIACFALQERLARQDAEALAEARSLWLSGREAPGACELVFDAAVEAGRLDTEDVWVRVRKLLAAGHLREALRAGAYLPSGEAMGEKQFDRASREPLALLREKASYDKRAQRELAVFAVARLARNQPEAAAEQLARIAPRLGAADSAFAWGLLAQQAAMQHHPQALAWYREAVPATLNDAQLTWWVRAALRAGDWPEVRSAISRLSPEEAREAAWRYWNARAMRESGMKAEAEPALRALAREPGFYGLLAAEDLGETVKPVWEGYKPSEEELQRVAAIPGIQRALMLYRIDRNELAMEALREWAWAIRGMDDKSLLAAAEVAKRASVPDRAINTAERTLAVHDYAQRYPLPHRDSLSAAAKQWSLDEPFVYALIRQESRFVAEARSRAGAVGLMQIMPATGRWIARQMGIKDWKAAMLLVPSINLQMGSFYFRHVWTDLGDRVAATAGYNAGPGRARRWQDARPLEAAIYAETIPFNETRDYVKKVMANTWYYSNRITGQEQSFRKMLGTVSARGSGGITETALTAAAGPGS